MLTARVTPVSANLQASSLGVLSHTTHQLTCDISSTSLQFRSILMMGPSREGFIGLIIKHAVFCLSVLFNYQRMAELVTFADTTAVLITSGRMVALSSN